jgi:hypothetical protein
MCATRSAERLARQCEEGRSLYILPAFETSKAVGLEEGAQLVEKVVRGRSSSSLLLQQRTVHACSPAARSVCPSFSTVKLACTPSLSTQSLVRAVCNCSADHMLVCPGDAGGKQEVAALLRTRALIPFAQHVYVRGHNATDFPRWLSASEAYQVGACLRIMCFIWCSMVASFT